MQTYMHFCTVFTLLKFKNAYELLKYLFKFKIIHLYINKIYIDCRVGDYKYLFVHEI